MNRCVKCDVGELKENQLETCPVGGMHDFRPPEDLTSVRLSMAEIYRDEGNTRMETHYLSLVPEELRPNKVKIPQSLVHIISIAAANEGLRAEARGDTITFSPRRDDDEVRIQDCYVQYNPSRRVLYVFHKNGTCVLRITGLQVPKENLIPPMDRTCLAEIQLAGHAIANMEYIRSGGPDMAIDGKAIVR